jgi:hypothetical protein
MKSFIVNGFLCFYGIKKSKLPGIISINKGKITLLNFSYGFQHEIGAKKNPPRDGPGRALFQARFVAP